MSLPEKVFAAVMVIFGTATLLCVLAGWLAARRDRKVGAGEAVQDAPRFVGRAVVASDDLEWQAALFGFQRDWERYQILDLLPGERAS